MLAPWSARNLSHFSSPALTASYGGYILAQRVIYNRMSWPEWGVAFIYWLPDFGDSLARDMYDPKYYEKLGFGPGTYYAEEAPRYYQEVVAAAGSVNAVAGYLLRHAVIGDPVKHTLVSLPLAVRALFPGRFCGLLGFASVLAVLVATLRRAAGTCSSGPAGNIHPTCADPPPQSPPSIVPPAEYGQCGPASQTPDYPPATYLFYPHTAPNVGSAGAADFCRHSR